MEGSDMKGYYVDHGFMGYVDGHYMLFATDTDYYETFKDRRQTDDDKAVRVNGEECSAGAHYAVSADLLCAT